MAHICDWDDACVIKYREDCYLAKTGECCSRPECSTTTQLFREAEEWLKQRVEVGSKEEKA